MQNPQETGKQQLTVKTHTEVVAVQLKGKYPSVVIRTLMKKGIAIVVSDWLNSDATGYVASEHIGNNNCITAVFDV